MLGCGEECPSYRALHWRTSRAVKKATEKNGIPTAASVGAVLGGFVEDAVFVDGDVG